MSLDSTGGIDQKIILRDESRDVREFFPEKLTDKIKLYFNQKDQSLRWESRGGDFSEPTFTEDENANEIEVDLSGVGNGKPILGQTDKNIFQVLQTVESSEPFEFPENIKKIVDLNSGEWVVKPNNQGIALKPAVTTK